MTYAPMPAVTEDDLTAASTAAASAAKTMAPADASPTALMFSLASNSPARPATKVAMAVVKGAGPDGPAVTAYTLTPTNAADTTPSAPPTAGKSCRADVHASHANVAAKATRMTMRAAGPYVDQEAATKTIPARITSAAPEIPSSTAAVSLLAGFIAIAGRDCACPTASHAGASCAG